MVKKQGLTIGNKTLFCIDYLIHIGYDFNMAQQKAASSKTMIGYKVNIQQHCDHSERSEEEYGSWSESYSNSYESISKVANKQYADVYSTIDLDKQEGFLVWAEYSTGDSFGNSDRGSVEVLALFSSMAKALEFKKKLEDWTAKKNDGAYSGTDFDYNFKAKVDKQEIQFHVPWLGYFEHLDSINIESIAKK